ncbi:GtrA family protein, partial [Candidatus Saccharibacteria bacterium]|nr:GtrA family protein [Candidatus Saccharibacteria bacterium]
KVFISKIYNLSVFRYLVSGGTAFTIEYGSFLALFYLLKFGSITSNTVSFILGLLTSFLLNRLWVFSGDNYQHSSSRQLFSYIILALFNLLLTNVAMIYVVNLGIGAYIAKVILIVMVASWNYIIFKTLIFKNDKTIS